MKKINLLLVFCLAILTFAQAQIPPQAFNYSAVARNAAGQPIATATIGIKISILKTSTLGTAVYSENHFVNTDAFGLFNLVIGGGAVQSGSMSTIDWSNDNYYLKVGMDATGGTNFLTMGTTQLLSVPYALYAKSAGTVSGGVNETDPVFSASVAGGISATDTANWNNQFSGNYNDLINKPITVTSISTNGDTLQLSNGQSFISASSSTNLPSIATDNVTQYQNSATTVNVTTTILNDGGETIILRGICYGTNPNLTTSNSSIQSVGGGVYGVSNNTISNLLSGTQYYFKSFAVNVNGTSYGTVVPYLTPICQDPILLTNQATNIQPAQGSEYFTATLNGEVTSFGTGIAEGFGICYSSSPNPTISTSILDFSINNGIMVANISSLLNNTTYYVRTFYTNGCNGIVYGNEINFTTPVIEPPVVITQQVTYITNSTAQVDYATSSSGQCPQNTGVCVSTNPNPTTSDLVFVYGSGNVPYSPTSFSQYPGGLNPNTIYYVRPYVTYCGGTIYGNQLSFTTLP